MGHEKSSSGRELIRTVASKRLADAVFDATEMALDENLPVIGFIVKIVRAGQSIVGELFVRKLLRFLNELQGVFHDERERLLQHVGWGERSEPQQDYSWICWVSVTILTQPTERQGPTISVLCARVGKEINFR